MWATAGLAAIAGLASYAVFGAGSFALTQRLDPTMATLERNRYIAGGFATVLGIGVAALASPVIGAGLAAGGLVALAGTDLYLAIGKVIDKAPPAGAAGPKQIRGIYDDGQRRTISGIYDGGQRRLNGIGGVYYPESMAG
jgi:hypothetical protein